MKRALIGLSLVLLACLGALAWTFTPATFATGGKSAFELPRPRPPQGMKLSVLPTGQAHSRAMFAYRGGSLGEARPFSMAGILVQHPQGALLFDTGFGRQLDAHVRQAVPALMRAVSNNTAGPPVADQLAQHSFPLERLAGVVLTHAHWDHASGLPDLPGVPVWVNSAELDYIRGGHRGSTLLASFGALDYRVYDFTDGPYLGFERSLDVFKDGSVVLVPAPGHTPGSILAFIHLPEGQRYVLVGDLVWQREGFELPAERPWLVRRMLGEDDEAVRQAIARLHQVRAVIPELVIVPAHDARVMDSLPRFPH